MKITYNNKSSINVNPDIPVANKVTDTDMNEIKSVVNANDDNTQAELYYEVGDTIEIGGITESVEYVASGYISASTTSIFVTVITPKRLDNITSITVTSLNVQARGTSGYINSQGGFNEYVGVTGYTISADKSGSNAITIRLTKSSAFTNTSNNTPVCLNGYFGITLS